MRLAVGHFTGLIEKSSEQPRFLMGIVQCTQHCHLASCCARPSFKFHRSSLYIHTSSSLFVPRTLGGFFLCAGTHGCGLCSWTGGIVIHLPLARMRRLLFLVFDFFFSFFFLFLSLSLLFLGSCLFCFYYSCSCAAPS